MSRQMYHYYSSVAMAYKYSKTCNVNDAYSEFVVIVS